MLEIIKNSALTIKKGEIDVIKNGKNFMAPRFQNPSVQSSRVQAYSRSESMVQGSSCPVSKAPVVQSLSVQLSSVQQSRVQTSRPYAQSPVSPACLFKHCHSNFNAIYSKRFCWNFTFMFIHSVKLVNLLVTGLRLPTW